MGQEYQQYERELQQIIKFTNCFSLQAADQTLVLTSRHKSYMLKDMLVTNQDQNQLPAILGTLSLHENLNPKYLLTLLHYEVYKAYDGNQYIKAIYQYGKLTLRQQIQNRTALGSQFDQDEIWAILAMVVKALAHLEDQGIVYGVLGTDKVFIGDYVKLLDPSATATDPLLISQGRLYSPQILNDKQQINMFKSDIYVLALMLLQCGLLIDLSKEVEPDLTKHLQIFSQLYSKQLYSIVQSMLQVDPQSRPSFSQLKNHLVQEMQMNTTQINQPCIPCLSDTQNITSGGWIPQHEQQQINDVLYESISLRNHKENNIHGNNNRNANNHNNNKENSSNTLYESQCSQSECVNTEYQDALNKYLAIKQVQFIDNKKDNNSRLHFRKNTSPISTQKSSRVLQAINNSNQNRSFLKKQIIQSNQKKTTRNNSNNRNVHNYSRSQGSLNQFTTDFDLLQSTTSTHVNTQKKQRTKQIKHRLVKNIDDSDLIREEDIEEEENSNILSNCSDYCNNASYGNYENPDNNKEYNNKYSVIKNKDKENSHLNRNFIKNPRNSESGTYEFTRYQHEKTNSLRSSRETSKNIYSNTRIVSQQNHLFTDPDFLKNIQDDLARIETSKNSSFASEKQRYFK